MIVSENVSEKTDQLLDNISFKSLKFNSNHNKIIDEKQDQIALSNGEQSTVKTLLNTIKADSEKMNGSFKHLEAKSNQTTQIDIKKIKLFEKELNEISESKLNLEDGKSNILFLQDAEDVYLSKLNKELSTFDHMEMIENVAVYFVQPIEKQELDIHLNII